MKQKKKKTLVHFVKMNQKISIFLLVILINSALVFSHGGEEEESFTPGVNPIEYFIHGEYISGFLIIGLWLLIISGIYTLSLLVIGKHIK